MNLDRLKDFLNDPGRRIGKYEIVREVGRGGMGIVYEAFDPDLRRTVALKVLKHPDADRLRREAAQAAKLRHPNIVVIHEVGPDYIAMEFVPGRARVDRATLRTVARAMAYAHRQGVVHRDLKPGNLLVHPDGRVVITDFGLSAETTGGTPGYEAPTTGPEADVHALGVMAREAGLGPIRARTADDFARRLDRRPRALGAVLGVAALAVAFWPRGADPLRDWSVREERLTREIERDPGRVDLLLERSALRMARSDYGRDTGRNPLPDFAGAEADLTRVLELGPGGKEALALRGRARVQRAVYKIRNGVDPLSDLALAEKDLEAAGDRTWLGNARFHRGSWILRTGGDPRPDFEAADADLSGEATADTLMRRGRVRAYLKRYDEAEADFARSVEGAPGNVWAWTWRANARRAAGDPASAETFYTRAIEARGDFPEAWEGRGHARFERRDYAGAAKDFEEAIRLNPSLGPTLASRLEEARGRR
ncbi:MAG TPA: tetratricopeptide repeat protein [Planctomycetota bacterium]|nr:tetratricopeptide repeat protein [Planctomycetota bacterium]